MEKEIKELQDKLDALKLKYEQSKQPFNDGDVVNLKGKSTLVKITNYEKSKGFGINSSGQWVSGIWSFKNYSEWQLSTPEKWLEVCTKEAVKRGFKEGCIANNTNIHNEKYNNFTFKNGEFRIFENRLVWAENKYDYYPNWTIMKNGIWAEVMKPDKALEKLHIDYMDINNNIISYPDYIKANAEAYIKAIQNLKK